MRPHLLAIVEGTTYDLYDMDFRIWLDDDGLGMAPVHRLTQRGPLQHGETDIGYRLDPRIIQMVIGIFGKNDADYWDQRTALRRIFKPRDADIKLRFILPNNDIRQIDVVYSGGMSFSSSNRAGLSHKVPISLKANDPTFYNPTLQVATYGLPALLTGFSVPMPVPFAVGASDLDTTSNITYSGEWLTYPIIRINGPISDPVITNETTNETLDLTGYTVAATEWIEIDCRYGFKTVFDQAGVDRIAALAQNANDLATFHLEPDPDVAGGVNVIRVTGSGANLNTDITISYYLRYLGI